MNATASASRFYLVNHQSIHGVFALWSAKNRISSTCASIVSSKREIHRAIRHKNGERIERETLQILLNSPMKKKFYNSLEFFVRYVAPSKDSLHLIDEKSSNRNMHTYPYTHMGHDIRINTHSSLNQC